jgi:hypothetical protein
LPELHPSLGHASGIAARVTMPKATMHEQGDATAWECQIGATGQLRRMKPETQS